MQPVFSVEGLFLLYTLEGEQSTVISLYTGAWSACVVVQKTALNFIFNANGIH